MLERTVILTHTLIVLAVCIKSLPIVELLAEKETVLAVRLPPLWLRFVPVGTASDIPFIDHGRVVAVESRKPLCYKVTISGGEDGSAS